MYSWHPSGRWFGKVLVSGGNVSGIDDRNPDVIIWLCPSEQWARMFVTRMVLYVSGSEFDVMTGSDFLGRSLLIWGVLIGVTAFRRHSSFIKVENESFFSIVIIRIYCWPSRDVLCTKEKQKKNPFFPTDFFLLGVKKGSRVPVGFRVLPCIYSCVHADRPSTCLSFLPVCCLSVCPPIDVMSPGSWRDDVCLELCQTPRLTSLPFVYLSS